MGDVVTMINGVRITEVEMAAQIIKLTAGTVEIRTTNVFVEKGQAGNTGKPGAPPPGAPLSLIHI